MLLASAEELAAQGKGIQFWNLTTATISSFRETGWRRERNWVRTFST
jgi:hypothetical protein